MRIAIPCGNNNGLESEISMHFGRSPYYAFVDVNDNKVENVQVIPVPYAEHNVGDLPNFVKENRGEVVIAYGMGGRAADFFNQLEIKVVTGANGKVKDVVDAFLKGNIRTDENWRDKEEFSHHDHDTSSH